MDAAGKRITGRRKAVIVWDYFRTSAAHGGLYSFRNLMAVQLHSHNLVDFQAKWLTVCQGLKEPVAEAIRRDLFYKQIKDEPPLKFDVDQYLRAEAAGQTTGSPSFSLEFLESALEAAIVREREAKRAKEMDRSVQTPGEAAGATAPGAKSKAAKAAAKKAAAEASAADKAAEANKHKQSMARQVPADLELSSLTADDCKARDLCFAFQKGKCTKGKACPWKHIMAKTRERSPSPERGRTNKRGSKSRSRSRSGSREQRDTSEVPCKFFAEGKCTRGDQCFYKHGDKPGRKPAPKEARAFVRATPASLAAVAVAGLITCALPAPANSGLVWPNVHSCVGASETGLVTQNVHSCVGVSSVLAGGGAAAYSHKKVPHVLSASSPCARRTLSSPRR